MKTKAYYVTTPIYYVNDAPHIGHAYTTLACDVLARFKRLDGYRVLFLTGTDEHGQKVEKSAEAAGLDPKSFTDRVSRNFLDLTDTLNISNDDFIRTTEGRHRIACQALWARLLEKGEIYLDSYRGWYAVRDEAYYGEDELTDGPNGKKYAPSGAEVEWVEEPSYFFRLSAWQDRLLTFYDQNRDFIAPENRRNEVVSFVKSGLRDLSVSRTSFHWGIKVPGDEAHIMYVWLDALTNYITAVGFPDTTSEPYQSFWPADLHMVGKDILRFHAIYWPAFLMAAGLTPPRRVFAHGWWTNDGQKISKSLGNVIEPNALIAKYGLDQVRYFLLREISFGNDGDFSHTAMIRRINGDLANDFGNLAQRVLAQINKNCGAAVPTPGRFDADDVALLDSGYGLVENLRSLIDRQAFSRALEAIWDLSAKANVYIDRQAPWALKKTDADRMNTVLYVLAETLRLLGLAILPFMPKSGDRLLDWVGVAAQERDFTFFTKDRALSPGCLLPKPEGLFPRFLDENDAIR